MSDCGIEVGGGGSIAVDTDEMLRAGAVVGDARGALAALEQRVDASAAPPRLAAQLQEARALLRQAVRAADEVADGLRIAAARYGLAEHAAARLLQAAFAEGSAMQGWMLRTASPAGLAATALVDPGVPLTVAAVRIAQHWLETGRFEPQSDPVLIEELRLTLSSLDDGIRGFLGAETPAQVLHDDPAAPYGLESIAGLAATLLWPGAGGPLEVRRRSTRSVSRPGSIEALADRLPDGLEPDGQIRIERYDDATGPRWIVYSAGTVVFAPQRVAEPFDLESDVEGVADRPADAQLALLEAMRQAGVGPDDPVLLVGHSQGALNAMRIAEHGGYRVEGVVQFGGPTDQIPPPAGVGVLAFRHDEDLVPALGGVPAASLGAVVVTRHLPDRGRLPGPPEGGPIDGFPAHSMRNYTETVRRTERLHAPQVEALKSHWSGFLAGGEGEATRYRARRLPPVSAPGPAPTAAAAPAPPASR